MDWNITLPDNYRLEGLESNAEPAPAQASGSTKPDEVGPQPAGGPEPGRADPASAATARLRHNLSRDEPTLVELFYRSDNLHE